MIFDRIDNADKYLGLSESFDKAFSYLKTLDLSALEVGKHYEISPDLGFTVSSVKGKSPEDGAYETHQKFADIQVIVSGIEYMWVSDVSKLNPYQDYNSERDFALFKGEGSCLKCSAGDFVVFLPEDAHLPCCTDGIHDNVSEKFVIKVKL